MQHFQIMINFTWLRHRWFCDCANIHLWIINRLSTVLWLSRAQIIAYWLYFILSLQALIIQNLIAGLVAIYILLFMVYLSIILSSTVSTSGKMKVFISFIRKYKGLNSFDFGKNSCKHVATRTTSGRLWPLYNVIITLFLNGTGWVCER